MPDWLSMSVLLKEAGAWISLDKWGQICHHGLRMRNTTDDSTEIVRGSGNVFRDFGYPDADVRQAKALLAAQIIKVLDAEELTTRQAEARTGVAHSEFVRIRNVNLARFTMDRLVTILGRLDQEVEFSFTVHPRAPREAKPETAHL